MKFYFRPTASGYRACRFLLVFLLVVSLSGQMVQSQQITPIGPVKSKESPAPQKPPDGTPQTPLSAPPGQQEVKTAPRQVESIEEINFNAPRTPDEVTKYLIKMRKIIDQYDKVVVGILMGSSGLNTDQNSIGQAKDQTMVLSGQINAIVPPAQVKTAHGQLANTLNAVAAFLTTGADGTPASLLAAMSLSSQVHSTLESYHNGVLQVIASYNLSSSLDPFGGENQEAKSRFASGLNDFKTSKINSLQKQFASPGNSTQSGSSWGGSAGLPAAGSSDSGLGALNSLLGQMGGGQLNGLLGQPGTSSGASGLDSFFGQPGGSGNSQTLQDLGRIMQELQNQ